MFQTLYDILGVSSSCSQIELKKAYRVRSLKLHPDKNQAQDSKSFVIMKQAYDILSNPTSRCYYDAMLLPNIMRKFKQDEEFEREMQARRAEQLRRTNENLERKQRAAEKKQSREKELNNSRFQKPTENNEKTFNDPYLSEIREREVNEMKCRMEKLNKVEKEERLLKLQQEKEDCQRREKEIKRQSDKEQLKKMNKNSSKHTKKISPLPSLICEMPENKVNQETHLNRPIGVKSKTKMEKIFKNPKSKIYSFRLENSFQITFP